MSLYLDEKLTFSNKQAITGTAVSENVIDFGVGNKCSAAGRNIEVRVAEELQGGTSITFQLQDSDDGVSFNTKVTTTAMPTAALNKVTGEAAAFIAIPKGLGRFIRLNYSVAGTYTSGKITAMIVAETN